MGLNAPFTHEAPTISAGAIITDGMTRTTQGNLLLVKQPHKVYPDLPGGIMEPGETPLQALFRELEEEMGLLPSVVRQTRLVHVDSVIKSEAESTYLAFVFHVQLTVPLERFVGRYEEFKTLSVPWAELPLHIAKDAPILFKRIDLAWHTIRYGMNATTSLNGLPVEF